jgi:hypothetical protein
VFVDPAARRPPSETSGSARPLAASLQAPRRGSGEYEGSAQHGRDTPIRGIAILGAILVDALDVVPKERRRCAGVALEWVRPGLGHGRAAKELVDQRAAALGVVEEGGVAAWYDLEPRVG